jgi:hypothetical protein
MGTNFECVPAHAVIIKSEIVFVKLRNKDTSSGGFYVALIIDTGTLFCVIDHLCS